MVILLEINELRKLSNEELQKKVVSLKEELFNKRMQQANGTLEHPSELRKARKEVARIKTILKEREIAGGIE
jgi:large subunit ribosomal protein L29